MILKEKTYLVTRNSRNKVQTVTVEYHSDGNSFVLKRKTGQLGGKITNQPEKIIEVGKAKRTVLQQADLEYNSIINKYCNKGYKKLSELTKKKIDSLTHEEIDKLVAKEKTDANGVGKPMLAKRISEVAVSNFEKEWYASSKLDGVRCIMFWKDGEIRTASRGGKNYDASTTHIRNNVTLIGMFKSNPKLILDGELYNHGNILQDLSGIARKQEYVPGRSDILEYWVYDLCDSSKIFKERLEILKDLQVIFEGETQIRIIDHILITGYVKIKTLHDKWVKEGYEGLVLRNPNKPYEFGGRKSTMLKMKDYEDDEFKIIGYKEGARGIEDMTFTLITKDGKPFGASPLGTREDKKNYVENMDKIIGKMGTVKFFNYSAEEIPTQTTFKAVRDYE